MTRTRALPLLLVASAMLAAPAAAETVGTSGAGASTGAGASHTAWRDCLRQAYGLRASLSSPDLAADAALRACREAETAYLAALSTSPMLDAEDVTRVRPALVTKARAWLTGRGAKPAVQARAL